jgi:hypothetical protein
MIRTPARGALAGLFLAAVIVAASPATALAQYRPLPAGSYSSNQNPVGEPYWIEFGANLWGPQPDIVISSESLGIAGTDIDVQANLGVEKKSTYELALVLRPSKKNKFRFNYIPLKYDADTTITGEIIFNGIRYPVNTQVRTLLEWKTYRVGWEWDFISQPRWFIGSVFQVKWTDVNFELNSPIGTEFARAKAPIPAIGFIGRAWVTTRVAITGEWSAFKLPDTIDSRYGGHDYEWDVNGMVNITKNVGVRAGWRSHDIAYRVEADRGSAILDGFYFGGVVRY